MASSSDQLYSAIEATVSAFFKSQVEATRTRDYSLVSSTLAPDCRRHFFPESMSKGPNVPLPPVVDNATYQNHIGKELSALESAQVDVLHVSIDTKKRSAGAHAKNTLKLLGKDITIEMEMCYFFELTEDGTKIKKIVQFADTAAAAKMFAMFSQAMSKGPQGQ